MSAYDPAYIAVKELRQEIEGKKCDTNIQEKLKNIEDLMKEREKYCADNTSQCSDIVERLMKETNEHPWDKLFQEGKTKFNMRTSMMSGHVTGTFLQFLVSSSKAKKVLEIGTFTGCSALMMAEVLPSDGTVTTCDFDPYVQDLARQLVDKSAHGKKIQMLLGRAADTLSDLGKTNKKFDFIFIDADKKRYLDYFTICLDNLLAPGGMIVIDNAMFYGTAYTEKPRGKYGDHTRKLNDTIAQRDDIYHVLLPVRDGLWLIQRKQNVVGLSE